MRCMPVLRRTGHCIVVRRCPSLQTGTGGEHETFRPPHQVVAKRRRDLSEWFSPGLSGAVIVGGVGLLVLQLASTRDGRGDLPRLVAQVLAPPSPIWTGIASALPSHDVWESGRVRSGETAHAEYSNRQ